MQIIQILTITTLLALSAFSQTSLKAGDVAPIFTSASLDGNYFDLEQKRESVVVLTFWSTKCEICRSEIPRLNQFTSRYDGKKVVFLALTTESEGRVAPFLRSNPFKFTILPNSFGVVVQYADRSKGGNVSAQTKAATAEQPSFTAPNMEGKVITLSELRGKIVVVNLWFISCPNCLAEIKSLNELVAEYKDNKDVVFLAPAASRKPELEVFLKKNPFSYQVIPNASMLIITKFGTPDKKGEINIPFPMHYVIDREGKVVVKVEGMKGIEAVKSELKKQLASK